MEKPTSVHGLRAGCPGGSPGSSAQRGALSREPRRVPAGVPHVRVNRKFGAKVKPGSPPAPTRDSRPPIPPPASWPPARLRRAFRRHPGGPLTQERGPFSSPRQPEAASRRKRRGPAAPKQDGRPPRAPRREAAPPAEAAPGCPHLAWPLRLRPTAGLTPPRAGPQPARFRRRRSGRSLSPAPPAGPLRSPPPVPRPRRRQEPGCGSGRRRGERRGWIQHGGAKPEPGVRRQGGRSGEGARAGRAGQAGPRGAGGGQ